MNKYINPYLIQAYLICPREAWLEYRAIYAEQEDQFLSLGRLTHETSYRKFRRELFVDQRVKIDLFKDGLVAEIKKSSRGEHAARMQLLYYLYYLKREKGLEMEGVLLFPKEKRTEKVRLSPEAEREIEKLLQEMKPVLEADKPPPAKRSRYCRACAFREFCWA